MQTATIYSLVVEKPDELFSVVQDPGMVSMFTRLSYGEPKLMNAEAKNQAIDWIPVIYFHSKGKNQEKRWKGG